MGSAKHGETVAAAQAAVQADPLRESAHKLLIRAHLTEGNRAEALLQFQEYERMMREELGLAPSSDISALIAGVTAGSIH